MASRGRRMRPALERRAQVLVADATALVSPVVISLLAIERHRVAGYGRQHPGPQGEGPLVRTYAFAHNPPSLSVASQAWPSGSAAALSLSTRHAAWRLAEASSDRLLQVNLPAHGDIGRIAAAIEGDSALHASSCRSRRACLRTHGGEWTWPRFAEVCFLLGARPAP